MYGGPEYILRWASIHIYDEFGSPYLSCDLQADLQRSICMYTDKELQGRFIHLKLRRVISGNGSRARYLQSLSGHTFCTPSTPRLTDFCAARLRRLESIC